jgi:hypothetical protein
VTGLAWLPRARDYADAYGIDTELCESAVYWPTFEVLEAPNERRNYLVRRVRRGDLEVSVGLITPDEPLIMWVRMHLPGNVAYRSAPGGASGGSGAKAPTDVNELRKRIKACGYHVRTGGKHTRVERVGGSLLMALPLTPSDHRSVMNCWKQFLSAADADTIAQLRQAS